MNKELSMKNLITQKKKRQKKKNPNFRATTVGEKRSSKKKKPVANRISGKGVDLGIPETRKRSVPKHRD